MNEHFDVIIIGTGAGGGTLLNRLAPSGERILVLERGPFLPREKENWSYKGSFKYYSSEVMYIERRSEPDAHDHRQRPARRRSFDRAITSADRRAHARPAFRRTDFEKCHRGGKGRNRMTTQARTPALSHPMGEDKSL